MPMQEHAGWRLGALLGASLCAVVALATYEIWQSRRSALLASEEHLASLTSTLEHYLRVQLRVVDRTLARAAEVYRTRASVSSTEHGREFSADLGMLEDLVPDTMGLRGSDETGRVVYGTSVPAGTSLSVASRQFFAEAARAEGTVLGLPLRSRVTGNWVMPAVRALRRADGSFGGVVYVNLDLDAIGRVLRSAGTGVDGTIALFDSERRIYFRHPEAPSRKDEELVRFQAPETIKALAEGRSSAVYYTAQSSVDGRPRLVAFRKVEGFPLYVLASRSQTEVLAGWRTASAIVVAFVFAFAVLAINFHRAMLRAWRAREGALANLVEKDDALARSLQALEHSKQSVEQASRAKSAFLANMSHEIRTPMNAIVGLTHLALRDVQAPAVRSRLAGVNDAARHLLGLINDILDLSRIEAGKLELEEVEFERDVLLSEALAMVLPDARAKRLELVLASGDLPAHLHGDSKRLSQALINLLSNAVKFTDRGWVRLSARVVEKKDDQVKVRFEVRDTGPGVAEDRQTALFTPFEQADPSVSRRHGGTGLGLALTRHLAQLMGGEAGLESALGEGSTFWFTAWLRQAAMQASVPLDGAGLLVGRRVLVVDDLPASRDAVAEALASVGAEVGCAADCPEAAALVATSAAQAKAYDFVFVDQGLVSEGPGTVLDALRSSVHEAAPRLVLMDKHGSDTAALDGAIASFHAVLSQPATRSAIQEVLRPLLESASGSVSTDMAGHEEAWYGLLRSHAGKRVLLAEDNPVNQEIACELLRDAGLEVDVAMTGVEAVRQAQVRGYDLVLMDMRMPEMDGIQASREIRGMGMTLPIVAMTANAFEEDRQACLDAGMNDFVSKPVDPAKLYATVLRWMSSVPAVSPVD